MISEHWHCFHICILREKIQILCHVVGQVRLQLASGEVQTVADTFVASVCRAAAAKRADIPAFPHVSATSVWDVLYVLQVQVFRMAAL